MVRNFIRFRSSIYGRVVFIIAGSLIIVFVLFNLVFRSVYIDFYNRTISQNGNNISSIIEGSLYYSMLENDKAMLQRTLDIISTMPGIDEVNLYNDQNLLAYSSVHREDKCHCDPNCISCHPDMSSSFSSTEKSYMVVGDVPECGIHQHVEGIRHLVIRQPILNEPSCSTADCHAHDTGEKVLGSLLVTMPLEDLDAFSVESSTDFMLLALLIIAVLVTFLVVFTRKRIKDPLNSIIQASEAVSSGDTSIRLDIKPNLLDDMRMVSLAFNNMLNKMDAATNELQNWSQQLEYKVQKKSEELSEAQNELIHVERIASLGKLSSSVAHEINNPLSGILVYNKLIYKQLNSADFYHPKKDSILKNLKLIESETKRCGDIVKGLLDFSRKEQEDFEPVHIHKLLDETYRLMTHSIKIADISFKTDFRAGTDRVICSPNQVKQACVALVVNASEAVQEQGEITIGTVNPDTEHITIRVTDNGTGISKGDLPHIFEPFFSTKRDTSGIGLGLSIVHGIVENHKGQIEVKSEPGQGTSIDITLPLTEV
ncbi:MAG: ATP-binding protein [Bacteroidota bacterium]|nr:ATP-binding protein [Bacteroidota bacterium]